MPTPKGSFRLFQLFGITVFLHWSWFLVAYFFFVTGRISDTPVVNVAVYLSLFAIILTHEFGHALACRQTGGKAETIVLWPLGGVAYVSPPPRAKAVLWSVVAGPLVNVVLLPILWGLTALAPFQILESGIFAFPSALSEYLFLIALINTGLLIFNMIPIYPLDGGQTLQAILWMFVGRPKSLLISGTIGVIGAVLLFVLAVFPGDWILMLISVFIGLQAVKGLVLAKMMQARESWERMQQTGQWDPWRMMQPSAGAGFGGASQQGQGQGPIIDVEAHSRPDHERRH